MEPPKPFPIYQLMDAFEAFAHGEAMAKPQHRSLYYYLLGRARKLGNVVRFTLPYENGMHGSGIGSWATYDAALKALAEWGFLVYTPGANRFKVPVIELTFRNPTDDVLLTYWQSYCLSTSNPIDSSTGDNNRLIEVGKERIKELEKKLLDLEEAHNAANAATCLENQQLADRLAKAKEEFRALRQENEALKAQPVREKKAPAARRPPASLDPNDYRLPEWATMAFVAAYAEWLAYRQGKREKLQALSIQKQLDQLGQHYDEGFSLLLIEKAITNSYAGLIYDDTPAKYEIYKANQSTPFNPLTSHVNPQRNATDRREHERRHGLVDSGKLAASLTAAKALGF